MNSFFINRKGFTIIELIVVISIIAVLSAIIIPNVSGILENSKVASAGRIQREMIKAVQLYYADMGFYPPDVNRGCDPGLSKSTPWNPDTLPPDTAFPCLAHPACDPPHCPEGWETIVADNWHGPYLSSWPQFTPWGGKYDYNYWDTDQNRGCGTVPHGIYMGVEGNYDGTGIIPDSAEQKMLQYGFKTDCIDSGEAQMTLQLLP